jgi:hypothetical protein
MPLHSAEAHRHWIITILTDVHFWVPVVVLIAGLLLLGSIR